MDKLIIRVHVVTDSAGAAFAPKAAFGGKVSMLGAEEVEVLTGHPIGGVCPFGLKTPLPIYCDVSLQAFEEVVPAAGSIYAAVKIQPRRIAELINAEWGDVAKL
jgi:prolyl-tRNA editing enzyme YbaK/EbsC (Cys-tRNA(Pro) deacylase)